MLNLTLAPSLGCDTGHQYQHIRDDSCLPDKCHDPDHDPDRLPLPCSYILIPHQLAECSPFTASLQPAAHGGIFNVFMNYANLAHAELDLAARAIGCGTANA